MRCRTNMFVILTYHSKYGCSICYAYENDPVPRTENRCGAQAKIT